MCPAAQYDTGRALPSGRRRTHSKSPALLCSQQSLTALLAELTARGGARARERWFALVRGVTITAEASPSRHHQPMVTPSGAAPAVASARG